MQKVLTAEQMREVDRLTTERYGIPSIILMENAAHAVARVITEKLGGSVKGKSILVLCGKGNNGGDGAAIARLLHSNGAKVEVTLLGRVAETLGDARVNFERLLSLGSTDINDKGTLYFEETPLVDYWCHAIGTRVGDFDVFVDALFGTGLSRSLDVLFENLPLVVKNRLRSDDLSTNNETIVVSVDIPSGLESDTSAESTIHIEADITVTFTAPKIANVLQPASRSNGGLVVADIGSPQELIDEQPSQLYLAERSDAVEWLEKTAFSSGDYKNKRGHALIFAGSDDYSGAAVMCGNSAMRSGAGLTTLLVPASCKTEVASRVIPEVIVRTLDETDGEVSGDAFAANGETVRQADSILVGPGLNAADKGVQKLVREIVEHRTVPVIVDAGALSDGARTLLSASPVPPAKKNVDEHEHGLPANPPVSGNFLNAEAASMRTGVSALHPLILTPHEGEFLRLLGTDHKDAIKDRVAAVRDFAVKNNVILVLKGERVLIGAPDGRVVVNPTGNSGLGKAGNGDTLAGILAGFTAQAAKMDIDIFDTVVAAVYVAGMAGDVAEKRYGKRVMTASDVRECLTEVFEMLENK